ncbi:MAG: sigma-54-dependent Fis family transcriptional regulator, partial [Nitrospira sp.]|nr:sigma-54-dependent Fis family transcriptional regulator [Nitrospira sp.]
LRERKEDIPLLVEHFIKKISNQPKNITTETMGMLMEYPWKGNVRELENMIERIVLLTDKDKITPAELPPEIKGYVGGVKEIPELSEKGLDIDALIGSIETQYLLKALERANGVKTEAAKLLKLSFRSFRHRLQKYGIK